MPRVKGEKKLKEEIKRRGGATKVLTVHPNPNNKNEYAHVYVVRSPGKRGGKTVMGPIQRKARKNG